MGRIDAQLVAQRLREVVADEPKAFAYEIGVSLSALYNYLNGRIPSTEVLFRIACYTGRPMEWFLANGGSGSVSNVDLMVAAGRNGSGASVAVTH
ncbi:MAG TPA: helix-turn-helix transcriptional regulator [Candidatus Margulisiibacteriota bacterium]|nr:helix-turn-helix transcriptional regulator [Candidatus Margulisiibacteriota bacterium]